MRLIDADALIPIMKYTTTDNEIGVFPIRIGFDAIKRVIDDAPTIDAVEVVRCRDCIHWFPHTQCGFDEDNDEYHDYCGLLIPDDDYYAYTRKPDDYCSYGECREDGEKE